MRTIAFIIVGIIFAFGFIFAMMQPAKADDIVIIEGNGAGTIIEDTASVTVNEGEEITIVLADGSTKKITGPYTGAFKDAETTIVSRFESRGAETKVLGAVRAPEWDKPKER